MLTRSLLLLLLILRLSNDLFVSLAFRKPSRQRRTISSFPRSAVSHFKPSIPVSTAIIFLFHSHGPVSDLGESLDIEDGPGEAQPASVGGRPFQPITETVQRIEEIL